MRFQGLLALVATISALTACGRAPQSAVFAQHSAHESEHAKEFVHGRASDSPCGELDCLSAPSPPRPPAPLPPARPRRAKQPPRVAATADATPHLPQLPPPQPASTLPAVCISAACGAR
jgi:hypothetical protein